MKKGEQIQYAPKKRHQVDALRQQADAKAGQAASTLRRQANDLETGVCSGSGEVEK